MRRVTINSACYMLSDTRARGLPEAQTGTSDRSGAGNFVTMSTDTLNGQLAKTVYVRGGFGNVTSVTRCLAGQDSCTAALIAIECLFVPDGSGGYQPKITLSGNIKVNIHAGRGGPGADWTAREEMKR